MDVHIRRAHAQHIAAAVEDVALAENVALFLQIGDVVRDTLSAVGDLPADTIEQVYAADALARRRAGEIMAKLS